MVAGHYFISGSYSSKQKDENAIVPDDGSDEPVRNFTAKQLRYFDGTIDEKTQEPKRVYLSVSGSVFDVSSGRHFYGPDGPYAG